LRLTDPWPKYENLALAGFEVVPDDARLVAALEANVEVAVLRDDLPRAAEALRREDLQSPGGVELEDARDQTRARGPSGTTLEDKERPIFREAHPGRHGEAHHDGLHLVPLGNLDVGGIHDLPGWRWQCSEGLRRGSSRAKLHLLLLILSAPR
jgi:hypothetical protein